MGRVIIAAIKYSDCVVFSNGQSLEELDEALLVVDLSTLAVDNG